MFIKKEKKIKLWYWLVFFFSFFLFLSSFVYFFIQPASKFQDRIFEIKQNESLISVSKRLEKEGYIRSHLLFQLLYKIQKVEKVLAGKYLFESEKNIFDILEKFKKKDVFYDYIKFKIIPGEPNYLIAKKLKEKLKNFDEEKFLSLSKEYEGQLYPDTYFLDENLTENEILNIFINNFNKKNKEVGIDINGKEKEKILIIASLIEAEANGYDLETKKKIASVIYNRLEKKMPLQIDYVFFYIQKKDKRKLSPIAIERIIWKGKKIDSKFNNYKYTGLPPNPISNPVVSSIEAALKPLKTKYFYYITGKDKKFYFAKNLRAHLYNIKKYLR